MGLINFSKELVVIAGPCSIENEKQALAIAHSVKKSGANYFRGSLFKLRTSPRSYQGLGKSALSLLKTIKDETGLNIVTEVIDPRDVELILQYVDVLQIGARNMYNVPLLKEVGRTDKHVLLKRAMSASYEELICSAEYISIEGNTNIILCERGIKSFETYTRNTLDLTAVPVLKKQTPYPVIVDPTHGTGRSNLVCDMSLAALSAGADGLMIEVHQDPQNALSDPQQALTPDEFSFVMKKIKALYGFLREFNEQYYE